MRPGTRSSTRRHRLSISIREFGKGSNRSLIIQFGDMYKHVMLIVHCVAIPTAKHLRGSPALFGSDHLPCPLFAVCFTVLGLHFFQESVLILLPQRVEPVFISNTNVWHLCAEMSKQVIDLLLVASCIQGESRGDVDFLSAPGVNADEMEFCALSYIEEFIHPHHFVPSGRLQSRKGADQ